MTYHLAVDVGASSGRHILGGLENGRLVLEEIHRFKNGPVKRNGKLCWDVEALFEEILAGFEKCAKVGKIPKSAGIDTWGVDFVLIGKDGKAIGDAVSYRDGRTAGMDKVLSKAISESELYARTGIQKLPFNTVYQLLALKTQSPGLLEQADGFLMIPEYFSYLLTGVRAHEYTNATTTGLIDAKAKAWDFDLIEKAGLPRRLFGGIVAPGTSAGSLLPQIRKRAGFDCELIFPCCHDTACAVLGAPVDENSVYLSSGTWSLMGTELDAPICTEESRKANLTNEGGYEYKYRYLKNIMGLWIIQRIKAELKDEFSFEALCEAARQGGAFPSRIDVSSHRFMSPESMIGEVKAACVQSGQSPPESVGELMACVYHSLAESYSKALLELEALTNKRYDKICVIGGGSKDPYLNELTAKACGKKVSAGPSEATAIGNILAQLLLAKEIPDVKEARSLVRRSFPITEYQEG